MLKSDVCIVCAVLGWLAAVTLAVLVVPIGMGLVTGAIGAWRVGGLAMQFLPVLLVVMLPVLLVRAALTHVMGPVIFALVGMAAAVPAFGVFHEFFLPGTAPRNGLHWPGLGVFLMAGASAGAGGWSVERNLRRRVGRS